MADNKKEKKKPMTIYSLDLRKKAVALYEAGNISMRKVAERLMVSKNTVNEWLKLYREQGNVQPKRVGSTRTSPLENYKEEVKKMVAIRGRGKDCPFPLPFRTGLETFISSGS